MNYKQQNKKRITQIWGGEPSSLDELAQCVIAVINQQPADRWRSKNSRVCRVAGFAWRIVWTDVSNTHYAPINGVTNWGGRSQDAPRSYPGWTGRVWIRYAKPVDSFGSDPFQATLTYPGTGGWGSYDGPWEQISRVHFKTFGHDRKCAYPQPQIYSWDYRLFAGDWPQVTQSLEKQRVWSILQSQPVKGDHHFLWEDPEIKQQDQAFIKSLRETA